MDSPVAPSNLRVAKGIVLLVLSVGLVTFAVMWQLSGHQPDKERALARDQLGSGRVLRAVTELGQLGVDIDPRVFGGSPREHPGLLSFSRSGQGEGGPSPSTTFATAAFGDAPPFDVLSIALDPRDWRGKNGIYDNSSKRGKNWERGGCVSLFANGELVVESTVGVEIHGGSSRKVKEKSLRIKFADEYGTSVTSAELLPGAVGNSLVVHNDKRRMRFCNPISYELMALLGCDVPRTRPVRVMVNGELMSRIYFLSEHLNGNHIKAKLGHKRFVRLDEQGGHHSAYDKVCLSVRDRKLRTLRELDTALDVQDVITWLAGVLYCAPYDSRQGIAYLDHREQRWHWIVWDLDWSFGPWPDRMHGKPMAKSTIVADLQNGWNDIRSTLFEVQMGAGSEFRNVLLARVSRALNHELTPQWCEPVIRKYRGIARTYAPDALQAPMRNLDAIAAFMKSRPEALRDELNETFGVGPVVACAVHIPEGAAVLVDGFEYRADWSGDYFHGQEVTVEVPAGYELNVNGSAVAGPLWRGSIVSDTIVHVTRK